MARWIHHFSIQTQEKDFRVRRFLCFSFKTSPSNAYRSFETNARFLGRWWIKNRKNQTYLQIGRRFETRLFGFTILPYYGRDVDGERFEYGDDALQSAWNWLVNWLHWVCWQLESNQWYSQMARLVLGLFWDEKHVWILQVECLPQSI